MIHRIRKGVVYDDIQQEVRRSQEVGTDISQDYIEELVSIFLLHVDESLRSKNIALLLSDQELNVPCTVRGGYKFKGNGILRKFTSVCRMTIRGGAFEKWHGLIYDGVSLHYANSPHVSISPELVLKKTLKRLRQTPFSELLQLPFDDEENILRWVFQSPIMDIDYTGVKDKEYKRRQEKVVKKWIEKKRWIDEVFRFKSEHERAVLLDKSLTLELGKDYKKYIQEDGQM